MLSSEARIETPHAERYLGQLCKHFGHRIPVSLSDGAGRIEFPSGICSLTAETGSLILRNQAEDLLALRVVEGVVGSHLERFAFGEQLAITWATDSEEA